MLFLEQTPIISIIIFCWLLSDLKKLPLMAVSKSSAVYWLYKAVSLKYKVYVHKSLWNFYDSFCLPKLKYHRIKSEFLWFPFLLSSLPPYLSVIEIANTLCPVRIIKYNMTVVLVQCTVQLPQISKSLIKASSPINI